MKLLILIAGLLSVVSFARAEGESSADVITGNAGNFESIIADNNLALVKFYAPWCGHCKRMAPEFNIAATELKGTAALVDVDCTTDENRELCGKYDVQGYPTLKIFRKEAGGAESYEGPRDATGMIKYMKKQTQDPFSILKTVVEIEQFKKTDLGILAYLEHDTPAWKEFTSVAAALRNDYDFGIITDKDFFEGRKAPHAVLYRTFDTLQVDYEGEFNKASLETFIGMESFPLFGKIGPENYGKYAERGIPIAWVFLNAHGKESHQTKSAAEAIAPEYKGKLSFVSLDAARWAQHGKSMGLQASPGIVIQDAKNNYVLQSVTKESLAAHCKGVLDGTLKPHLKSQEIPESNDGPVKIIVGKTFEEIAYEPTKDVFVEFYAPWCGHCKNLEPTYDALGKRFAAADHIVIAKMDATENDSPADVSGFPTLIYYPGDNKEGILYVGDRSEDQMAEFIEANAVASVKAELKHEDL